MLHMSREVMGKGKWREGEGERGKTRAAKERTYKYQTQTILLLYTAPINSSLFFLEQ